MIKCIMSTELLLATLKLIKNNLQPQTDGLNVFLDHRNDKLHLRLSLYLPYTSRSVCVEDSGVKQT